MTLLKYHPARNLFALRNNFENLFDDFLNQGKRTWSESTLAVVPAIDLEETDDAFVISAELPGMDKKEINISFDNSQLTISGEKKSEKEMNEEKFHRIERTYGKFQRSFELPGYVERDKIEAEYNNGILTVTVPKAEEAKPKQIEVKIK